MDDPEAIIWKLNEEHGFVRKEGGLDFAIGDEVTIIPNHVCTVVNLCDELYAFRGESYEGVIRVDARGKNR
jgi:D-serine deaminase-like pyridoxal phosphate-dependent protein